MAVKSHTCKAFLLCNYVLLGASSTCIFLKLSLRMLSSPCGLLLLFLHALTAVFSAAGCSGSFTAPATPAQWHNAHTAGAALAAIFQGVVALLAFTRTSDFLVELQSYVRDDDGAVILKMVGGLGTAIFVVEWATLMLAFSLSLDYDGDLQAKSWQSCLMPSTTGIQICGSWETWGSASSVPLSRHQQLHPTGVKVFRSTKWC